VNDDWRLRVDVREAGFAHALSERLDASQLEHELQSAFADRVIVSVDGPEVFCYTGTLDQAVAAERLIHKLAGENNWQLQTQLARWHPDAEAWEDAHAPMPDSPAAREAEHAELIRREQAEAAQRGYPSFEVRVQCRSERDCAEFAARLTEEGLSVVRRGRFLLIGAADEDAANALAARVHEEAPEGTAVLAEGTLPAVFAGTPLNPFAVFGGLGG
jgi:hypothetical protein